MNCDEIREKLIDYPDGVPDPGELEALEEHLAVCPSCREEREALANAYTQICQVMETAAAGASPSPNI